MAGALSTREGYGWGGRDGIPFFIFLPVFVFRLRNDPEAARRWLERTRQSVVTGGWATAPGQRMLLFLRPELLQEQDGTQFIVLRGHGMEVPEATLGKFPL